MESAAAMLLPQETEPLQIVHRCVSCGNPFIYRHDGHYHRDMLRPVDWVCRRCFPTWVAERELA